MSGLSHLEQKFARSSRRSNAASIKVEEKRLQSLLNFIDSRMQEQRSKLRRQIEDTQQTAEEMEEKKHRATLQVLKNYFGVQSGRVAGPSHLRNMHEERMTGVLSEPSLATVPEVDPDILAKPRSMYDRITRGLDTSRLPLIAPKSKGMVTQQSMSLPASVPNSNRSDESSTPRVIMSPLATPSSTPRNPSTPSDSTDEMQWSETKKTVPTDRDNVKSHMNGHSRNPNASAHKSQRRNGHKIPDTNEYRRENYNQLNGHVYQKGAVKPASTLSLELGQDEPSATRLGDIVASKRGLTRHSSLKRPLKSNLSVSTMSLSDLQPTRKQQAASKLKTALKGGGSFRIPR